MNRRYGTIVMLILATCMLVVTWRTTWATPVPIGHDDDLFIQGFLAPESFAGQYMRWSTDLATVRVLQPPPGLVVATVRLLNSYPAGTPPPQVTLRWPNTPPLIMATIESGQIRRYQSLIRSTMALVWYHELTIQSTTWTSPQDPRPLGIVVSAVGLSPTTMTTPIPAPAIVGVAVGLIFLLTVLCQYLFVRPIWQITIPAMVGVGIAYAGVIQPYGTQPFLVMGMVVVTTLVVGYGILARMSRATGSIAGAMLPLVGICAWWLLAGVQGLQALMGMTNGLRGETAWLGAVQVGLIGLAFGWAYIKKRWHDWPRAVAVALCGGAMVIWGEVVVYAMGRDGTDFWILFKGARNWGRGGSLYDINAVLTNHVGAVFKVPPFYGMLFQPFVEMSGLTVMFWYRLATIVIAVLAVVIWWRTLRPAWYWAIPAVAMLGTFRPLVDTISSAQIDIMLLLLIVICYWALYHQRDGLAGGVIAVATLFKIYPILLLGFFIIKGRWRAVVGFVIGMLVCNGIAIAVMGWDMHRIYLFDVLPNIGGTTSWVENQTISGFITRWFDVPFDAHIFALHGVSLVAQLCSLLVIASVCVLALRNEPAQSTRYALQYGLFVVLMVLAVPAAWMHYQTILSVVFLWLLYHLRTQQLSVRHAWLFGLSYGLIAFGNQWSFNNRIDYGIITTLGVSYKFYGMVLLLVLIGWQLWHSTANWRTPLVQVGLDLWRWLHNRRPLLEVDNPPQTQPD